MLTLFLLISASLFPVGAEVPDSPATGLLRSDASFSYFQSTANYESDGGSITDLPNSGEYSLGIVRTALSYDLSSEVRAWGGVNAGFTSTNDGFEERTNSGLSDLFLGTQYWVKMYRWRLVAQGDFHYPMFRVDKLSDNALVGEGAIRIRPGAWAIIPWRSWQPFAYLGFEYRDDGRSSIIPYAVGAKYTAGKWWAQGEIRGFESIIDDDETGDRVARELFLNRIQGGSYKLYSLNPAQTEISVETGFDIENFMLYGGLAMVVNGSNTADGFTFMVGVGFSPQGSGHRTNPELPREEYESPVKETIEDRFQNADPLKPPPRYREVEEESSPRQAPPAQAQPMPMPDVILQRKPVRKKKPPKPILRPNPQTDRMMKDIEKELERGVSP